MRIHCDSSHLLKSFAHNYNQFVPSPAHQSHCYCRLTITMMAAPPPHHHTVLNEMRMYGVVAAYNSPYEFMASPFGRMVGHFSPVSRGTMERPRADAFVLEAQKRARDILVLLILMCMDRSSDEEALDFILGRCSFWVEDDTRRFRSVMRGAYFKVCYHLGLATFTSVTGRRLTIRARHRVRFVYDTGSGD